MALKGLDIFKLSPKKNCKECGSPTCMAFCMKVAQGAVSIDKCPYFSDDAKAMLNEQTAPPMKTITVGDHKLGGETVLFRHEKTLVNKNLYSVPVSTAMSDAEVAAKLASARRGKMIVKAGAEKSWVNVTLKDWELEMFGKGGGK